MGQTFENPEGYVFGTPGDDVIIYNRLPTVSTSGDGDGGSDRLIVSFATDLIMSFRVSDSLSHGHFSAGFSLDTYGATASIFEVEHIAFVGGSANDRFDLTLGASVAGQSVTFDGGSGIDLLSFDVSRLATGLVFHVDNGAIASTFGTFSNFERFEIDSSAGDDDIKTGAGDDRVHSSTGSDVIDTGAGDDDIYSLGGGDTIDGGVGRDWWGASFKSTNSPLIFTLGNIIQGSNGVTVANVETVSFGGGGGDDLVSVTSAYGGGVAGGLGSDTLSYSLTDRAVSFTVTGHRDGPGAYQIFGGSSFQQDGVENGFGFNDFEVVNLQGGQYSDSFSLYGLFEGSQISIDGGSGVDRLYADLRAFASGSTFVVAAGGIVTSNRGSFAGLETYSLVGGEMSDRFVTGAGGDSLGGERGNDTLDGGDGDDSFSGGAGDDVLIGGGGNDFMVGDDFEGGGADRFEGGAGDDLYFDVSNLDTVVERAGEGYDSVRSRVDFVLPENVEALLLLNRDNIPYGLPVPLIGTGNSLANLIVGNEFDNQLFGLAGNDTLVGSYGSDTLDGGDGNDELYAGEGEGDGYASFSINFPEFYHIPTLDRWTEVDSVSGGAGDDFVSVGYGNSADGGAHGEHGDELFISFAAAPVGVHADFRDATLSIGGGTITGFEKVNYVEGSEFADVIIFDAAPFPLSPAFGGSVGGREISAQGGNDRIIAGYDTQNVWGGDGNDHLDGSASQYLSYLDGGSGSDTLIGNRQATVFNGGEGNDTITGGAGADRSTGGSGNDTFRDMAADLNGDTITDFAAGDRIVISDASLAGFSFSITGNTLTYTGGSLTLGGAPTGRINARAAAGGGVELSFQPAPTNDFNGDGRSDMLWRHSSGGLTDWLGQANGGFVANNANAYQNVDPSWTVAGTGDFNGDGRGDILWRHSSGTLAEWLGQANGGFTGNANVSNQVDTSWKIAGTADFNGDGRDDILWRHSSGTVGEWLGQANGGFAGNANVSRQVGNDWKIAGTGDYNGDGRADILWRHTGGQMAEWLGQANGDFAGNANVTNQAGADWHIVGSGDFNGDGRDDILWRSNTGAVAEWSGQANGSFVANANGSNQVDRSWHVASIGDFNGDGRDDIAWRNDNGAFTEWLGQTDGGIVSNHAVAGSQSDIGWQVQSPDILLV